MNEAIYQLAGMGHTIRLVIQKKPDGDFILGISNGKDAPLICQGTKDAVDAELESALPGYLEKLKAAAIEAQLNSVDAPEDNTKQETPDYTDENSPNSRESTAKPAATAPAASATKNDQPELDFGF